MKRIKNSKTTKNRPKTVNTTQINATDMLRMNEERFIFPKEVVEATRRDSRENGRPQQWWEETIGKTALKQKQKKKNMMNGLKLTKSFIVVKKSIVLVSGK